MPSRYARFGPGKAYNEAQYTDYSERAQFDRARVQNDRRHAGASRRAEFRRARVYEDDDRYAGSAERAEPYRAHRRYDDQYAGSERYESYRTNSRRDDQYSGSERSRFYREDAIAHNGPHQKARYSKARYGDVNVSRPKSSKRKDMDEGVSDTWRQGRASKSSPPTHMGPYKVGRRAKDGTPRESSESNPMESSSPSHVVWMNPLTGKWEAGLGLDPYTVSGNLILPDMRDEDIMDWEQTDPCDVVGFEFTQ